MRNKLLFILVLSCLLFPAHMVMDVTGTHNECACPTNFYAGCYTGDCPDGTDYISWNNGASVADAIINTADTVSTAYIEYDAQDECVSWAVDSTDKLNDEQVTIFFTFYLTDAGETGVETNLLIESNIGVADRLYVVTADVTDKVVGYFKGGTSSENVISSNTVSFLTEYRVGYTVQTGADAGGKHSISFVAKGSDTSWTEDVEDLDSWSSDPDNFSIGENETGSAVNDKPRIYDVIIRSGYQAKDPNP